MKKCQFIVSIIQTDSDTWETLKGIAYSKYNSKHEALNIIHGPTQSVSHVVLGLARIYWLWAVMTKPSRLAVKMETYCDWFSFAIFLLTCILQK